MLSLYFKISRAQLHCKFRCSKVYNIELFNFLFECSNIKVARQPLELFEIEIADFTTLKYNSLMVKWFYIKGVLNLQFKGVQMFARWWVLSREWFWFWAGMALFDRMFLLSKERNDNQLKHVFGDRWNNISGSSTSLRYTSFSK